VSQSLTLPFVGLLEQHIRMTWLIWWAEAHEVMAGQFANVGE
jgi:hypothetical protein